jgi:hypothetical protein
MDQRLYLGAVARLMIDSNMYMVLGTADGSGLPWAIKPSTPTNW